jgi:hypothetical protein
MSLSTINYRVGHAKNAGSSGPPAHTSTRIILVMKKLNSYSLGVPYFYYWKCLSVVHVNRGLPCMNFQPLDEKYMDHINFPSSHLRDALLENRHLYRLITLIRTGYPTGTNHLGTNEGSHL